MVISTTHKWPWPWLIEPRLDLLLRKLQPYNTLYYEQLVYLFCECHRSISNNCRLITAICKGKAILSFAEADLFHCILRNKEDIMIHLWDSLLWKEWCLHHWVQCFSFKCGVVDITLPVDISLLCSMYFLARFVKIIALKIE